jgi:hypothetical protein
LNARLRLAKNFLPVRKVPKGKSEDRHGHNRPTSSSATMVVNADDDAATKKQATKAGLTRLLSTPSWWDVVKTGPVVLVASKNGMAPGAANAGLAVQPVEENERGAAAGHAGYRMVLVLDDDMAKVALAVAKKINRKVVALPPAPGAAAPKKEGPSQATKAAWAAITEAFAAGYDLVKENDCLIVATKDSNAVQPALLTRRTMNNPALASVQAGYKYALNTEGLLVTTQKLRALAKAAGREVVEVEPVRKPAADGAAAATPKKRKATDEPAATDAARPEKKAKTTPGGPRPTADDVLRVLRSLEVGPTDGCETNLKTLLGGLPLAEHRRLAALPDKERMKTVRIAPNAKGITTVSLDELVVDIALRLSPEARDVWRDAIHPKWATVLCRGRKDMSWPVFQNILMQLQDAPFSA